MLESISGKKVLVTGGAGFLGSFLCERLLGLNCKVICIDNLYTGFEHNLATLKKNDNFEFIIQNVCEKFYYNVDIIFNLACPASPVHYQRDPVETVKTNVMGTLNSLELARETGATVFQASTSEIYGDPAVHPQSEVYWGNVNPIGLRSCYDEGKRCAETLCFDFNRQFDVDVRVARIFNTYGPRMAPNDGRVVSNFITQAIDGRPLTIYGDGEQTRSFCYVEDLIEGILRLSSLKHMPPGPVNLGNPTETSVRELAVIISTLLGVDVNFVENQLPRDDPMRRKPNINQAKELLEWEPKVSLEEGLEKAISYFQQNFVKI